MSSIFSVPAPIKSLFDSFPLITYPPISILDDAMNNEFNRRKLPFQGPNSYQDNANSTFTLGVYNYFHESKTNALLSTDPWCLYAQFALCKKNLLGLPCSESSKETTIENRRHQHCLGLVSPSATRNETLPILIEGYSNRFIRSTEGINEILRSRVSEDPEQFMYIIMLDNVIYDCWITQIIYHTSEQEFLKLYSFNSEQENALLNHLSITNMKFALLKRNHFHLRHKEITKNIESTFNAYKSNSLDHLLQPIFEKCKKTLIQFQDMLGDKPFISADDAAPTYLELKIASYILCVLNLSEAVPLRTFVEENCKQLMRKSELTLAKLSEKKE